MTIKLMLDLIIYEVHVSGYGCAGEQPLFWLCCDAIEIILSIAVIIRLKNIRDDYGISNELTIIR
jgi:hypothetical protein